MDYKNFKEIEEAKEIRDALIRAFQEGFTLKKDDDEIISLGNLIPWYYNIIQMDQNEELIKKITDDSFIAKGQTLDNIAALYNAFRYPDETDDELRKRILEELKEERGIEI